MTVAGDYQRNGAQNSSDSEERPPLSTSRSIDDQGQRAHVRHQQSRIRDQVAQPPMPNLIEVPAEGFGIDFSRHIPDDVNRGYGFQSDTEVTDALHHASSCTNGTCEESNCRRLKYKFAHLQNCQQRRYGCDHCYLFIRLISIHGICHPSDLSAVECDITFCSSIRHALKDAVEKMLRRTRRSSKIRIGGQMVKIDSPDGVVPCSCCVYKHAILKP